MTLKQRSALVRERERIDDLRLVRTSATGEEQEERRVLRDENFEKGGHHKAEAG